MSRRKSALGVLLGALCISAFGATTALGAPTGYTLHECVAKGSGGTGVLYSSSTCETKSETGAFETKAIEGTQTVKATGTSSFVFGANIGGVAFKITCTGLEASPSVDDVLTGEEMHVTDEGAAKFTGCSVTAPVGKGCTVLPTLETVNLKSNTNAAGSTRFEPAEGTRILAISVSGCTSSMLNGEKEVKGTATSARESAVTQAFTATSGSELTFGGQVATFTGKYHLSTTNGTLLSLEKAGE